MLTAIRSQLPPWPVTLPPLAILVLVLTWGRSLPGVLVALVALLLAGAVLAAVHHAEVVALRVGEPFGSLVLAVAVTVIEVALIVTLMVGGGPGTASLARDTVFAAVMITCNGILGLCLLLAALRRHVAEFNPEGTGAAFAAVITIAALSLVLPTFTTSEPGPQFSGPQLAFAAVASLGLYALFVTMQTHRHRDYFLPVPASGADRSPTARPPAPPDEHAEPPSRRTALVSLALLVLALIAVVGDAKTVSPAIESTVARLGLPHAVVGVIIALLVLSPETLAAVRNARRDRVQISLNLALGSAMASIGLTIPVIAIASIWLEGPLLLGLGGTQLVLLALTAVTGVLTLMPGRATLLHGGIHLALLAAFLFLAASP